MIIKPRNKTLAATAIACALAALVGGCSLTGPQAIYSGRMAYNQAIAETNHQQMLMVPVHNRYEESNQLLSVASVTANVRVSSRASVQAGFGNSGNYDGNLVPFSGGFIYEENPTISYKPVTGEAYLQQLMSPIPLSVVTQVTQVLPRPGFAYHMLLESINDIHTPAFLYGDQKDDPRFERVVTIMTALTHENRLYWVEHDDDAQSLALVLHNPDADERVVELLQLLSLPASKARTERIIIPTSMALQGATDSSIGITTRSLWELVEILTAGVQVPAVDEADGVATPFPRLGRGGRDLTIGYSEVRPDAAYLAVEYRDGWYSIDDRDYATKRYFKLLGSLWSAAISQSLDDVSASPVLTVPVSR